MLFESIIISQLYEANSRNRAIDHVERGTFWDDLAAFADEVDREHELEKRIKEARKNAKFDRPTNQWVDVETGEVIGYEQT